MAKHPTHGGLRHCSDGGELKTLSAMPGHPKDRKGMAAERGFASGGSVMKLEEDGDKKPQIINAHGTNEMDEAKNETPGFSKGGRKKRAMGGMAASGDMAMNRMDRRPRRAAGGRAGHNPYSSAADMKDPTDDKAARGYEGVHQKGTS